MLLENNSFQRIKNISTGEKFSVKIKEISLGEKNPERFKYPKIRLEKVHSKSFRNKKFSNCLLLLYAIDLLTSVKIYNLEPEPKTYEEQEERRETGEKIALSELLSFLQSSLLEIYKKYWEVYFKVVLHKKDLEEAHFPKEKRTIINYLNWLVKYGYLNKYKREGIGSNEYYYKIDDTNTLYNNFLSAEYIVRLTEDQKKKCSILGYFPIRLEDLTLTEEERKYWEDRESAEEQYEKDMEKGKSRGYLKRKYGKFIHMYN